MLLNYMCSQSPVWHLLTYVLLCLIDFNVTISTVCYRYFIVLIFFILNIDTFCQTDQPYSAIRSCCMNGF